jgi:hypothetical protein
MAAAPEPAPISGRDAHAAASHLLLLLIAPFLVLPAYWSGAWPAAVAFVLAWTLAAPGHRFCVVISPEGILFERRWLGLLYHRSRWPLHAEVGVVDGLDFDAQGVYLVADDRDYEVFGPLRDEAAMRAIADRLDEALDRARAEAARIAGPQRRFLHPWLAARAGAFDLRRARRSPCGRIVEVPTRAPLTLGGVALPAGSAVLLNDDRYLDPAAPDTLRGVVLAGPALLPGLGREVRAGARLGFRGFGQPPSSVRGGFEGVVVLDGLPLDGEESIGMDRSGRVTGGVLARSHRLGRWEVPAGSRLWWTEAMRPLPARWTVTLAAPLELSELQLEAGDWLDLDQSFALTGVYLQRDRTIGGVRLRGGVMSAPARPDGRIDLRAARKAGLVL